MNQKLSLGIIIGISIVIISSWIFLIVPDLKNSTEYFETFLEYEGEQKTFQILEKDFDDPVPHMGFFRQQILASEGNILTIHTQMQEKDSLTGQVLWDFKREDTVDRLNRKSIESPDTYYLAPYNLEQKNFMFWSIGDSPMPLEFSNKDFLNGLDVYVFDLSMTFDITGQLPGYDYDEISSDINYKFWFEPKTGQFLKFEGNFIDYIIIDGERLILTDGVDVTTNYSEFILSENARSQKNLFILYDTIIPILLSIISTGSILVVFVNQNLRTRTKELRETKRKKAEEVLYEVIPSPVITFDQNNKLADCNQYFLDTMGFSKDELMRMHAPDFLSEKDKKTYRDVILPSLKEGKPLMEIELHIKKKDGSLFHSLWNHIRMSGDDDEYLGFTAIGLDLTEIDKLRDELVKKEKFSILGQLAANIAHDIRNPLSVIRVSLENLKLLYGIDDQKQEQFERLERSIKRIVHQVDGVLHFVQERPLTLSKTSISKVIEMGLDSIIIPTHVKLILPKNNIELVCDQEKFSVLLYNLVLNGIQAIVGSGTIEISVEENNDRIVIQVEDSGKGIPKEELDAIFEPLFTTKQQGTGLGLSSVKSIIKAHGGTISVTSPPTIFRIELPKSL